MREIKFRGKATQGDFSRWVYGSLLIDYAGTCQMWEKQKSGDLFNCIVIPSTIGQYTGLKDRNGVEIYEGDVVRWFNSDLKKGEFIDGVVIFEHGRYVVDFKAWHDYASNGSIDKVHFNGNPKFEVIGNVHDNPEMVEVNA